MSKWRGSNRSAASRRRPRIAKVGVEAPARKGRIWRRLSHALWRLPGSDVKMSALPGWFADTIAVHPDHWAVRRDLRFKLLVIVDFVWVELSG